VHALLDQLRPQRFAVLGREFPRRLNGKFIQRIPGCVQHRRSA
jgi:hypothetical protein